MQAIAYVGQFNNGQLYASGKPVKIPEGQKVVVTFLGSFDASSHKKLVEDRRLAAQNFLTAMQELRDMGFDEKDNASIDELQSGTYKLCFEERAL